MTLVHAAAITDELFLRVRTCIHVGPRRAGVRAEDEVDVRAPASESPEHDRRPTSACPINCS